MIAGKPQGSRSGRFPISHIGGPAAPAPHPLQGVRKNTRLLRSLPRIELSIPFTSHGAAVYRAFRCEEDANDVAGSDRE